MSRMWYILRMGTRGEEDRIRLARERIAAARQITALTGAGVSAESGVPTFRGADGLWRTFRPEDLATPEAFARDSRLVWEWYAWRMTLIGPLRPNPAHRALADLERRSQGFLLITQNVDGLHQRAGSRNLVELHGNIWRMRCLECGQVRTVTIAPSVLPPHCEGCGGAVRPDVVWFGEEIPRTQLSRALIAVNACDAMIVAGTSGVVQPAASFGIMAARRGAYVVEVNMETTPLSDASSEVLLGKAGDILPRLIAADGDDAP